MSWKPAPIIGGAYSDDAKAWTCQDTVNYIPVMAERPGGRSPVMLRGAPGMRTFCITGSNKPIRGVRNVEGLLLVVTGTTLYKVDTKGAATSIGTIPGVGRVSMSHNQITAGNQVAIANGQSGYVYNTVTGTLAQITDEGFPGAISFDFIDGYITGIEPARRFAFHSNLAAATDYNTLDRYEAEGSPDKLVGQIVDHREWWLFSERTIEPFVNTGAATGTFQRASNTMIEVGCASGAAIVQMDSSVFWVGNDGIVYRANGYTPTRISTHPIEQALARCNLSQCFAFAFEDQGHKIYYLTCPDGQTWGYDAATGEWHRRQSEGLTRWRINTLTKWNGVWIAGDYSNGRLYQLDWAVQDEAGAVLERRRITGVLADNQNRVTVDGVALVFDTGVVGVPQLLVPPPSIAGHLPSGINGHSVSYQYTVSGGVLPRTVTIVSGALPDGLSVNTSGLVTGTRTALGSYTWTVRVTGDDGVTADLDDSCDTIDDINSAIFSDSPILHWPLDETSGTTARDLSGNNYDGTYSGGTLTGSGFKMASYYTDNVVASTGSLSGSPLDVGTQRQWAIEAVVTRDAAQPFNNVNANIAAQWRSANFGYASIKLGMPSVNKDATSFNGSFTENSLSGAKGISSSVPPVNGQRTHILAERIQGVADTDAMNIYLNGVLSNTTTLSSSDLGTPSNGEQFTVGGNSFGYGWNGTVEHVAVYGHSLGAARALYHAQLLGLAT